MDEEEQEQTPEEIAAWRESVLPAMVAHILAEVHRPVQNYDPRWHNSEQHSMQAWQIHDDISEINAAVDARREVCRIAHGVGLSSGYTITFEYYVWSLLHAATSPDENGWIKTKTDHQVASTELPEALQKLPDHEYRLLFDMLQGNEKA
jgi:hypothetical protein